MTSVYPHDASAPSYRHSPLEVQLNLNNVGDARYLSAARNAGAAPGEPFNALGSVRVRY